MRNWISDYRWSTEISISYGSARYLGKLRSPTYQRGWTWIPSYVWVQQGVSVRKGVNSLEKLLVWGLKFFPGVQPLIHLTSILPWKAWRPLVATYGCPNSANLMRLTCTSSPFFDLTIRRIGGLQKGLRGQILLGAALGMWVRGADLASGSSPPLPWLLSILQNGKFLAGASEKNTEAAFQKSSQETGTRGKRRENPCPCRAQAAFQGQLFYWGLGSCLSLWRSHSLEEERVALRVAVFDSRESNGLCLGLRAWQWWEPNARWGGRGPLDPKGRVLGLRLSNLTSETMLVHKTTTFWILTVTNSPKLT